MYVIKINTINTNITLFLLLCRLRARAYVRTYCLFSAVARYSEFAFHSYPWLIHFNRRRCENYTGGFMFAYRTESQLRIFVFSSSCCSIYFVLEGIARDSVYLLLIIPRVPGYTFHTGSWSLIHHIPGTTVLLVCRYL